MKAKEIRLKNDNELRKDLPALREKIRDLRFKLHSQEVKNPREVGKVKREIAQIMTILSERERAASPKQS